MVDDSTHVDFSALYGVDSVTEMLVPPPPNQIKKPNSKPYTVLDAKVLEIYNDEGLNISQKERTRHVLLRNLNSFIDNRLQNIKYAIEKTHLDDRVFYRKYKKGPQEALYEINVNQSFMSKIHMYDRIKLLNSEGTTLTLKGYPLYEHFISELTKKESELHSKLTKFQNTDLNGKVFTKGRAGRWLSALEEISEFFKFYNEMLKRNILVFLSLLTVQRAEKFFEHFEKAKYCPFDLNDSKINEKQKEKVVEFARDTRFIKAYRSFKWIKRRFMDQYEKAVSRNKDLLKQIEQEEQKKKKKKAKKKAVVEGGSARPPLSPPSESSETPVLALVANGSSRNEGSDVTLKRGVKVPSEADAVVASTVSSDVSSSSAVVQQTGFNVPLETPKQTDTSSTSVPLVSPSLASNADLLREMEKVYNKPQVVTAPDPTPVSAPLPVSAPPSEIVSKKEDNVFPFQDINVSSPKTPTPQSKPDQRFELVPNPPVSSSPIVSEVVVNVPTPSRAETNQIVETPTVNNNEEQTYVNPVARAILSGVGWLLDADFTPKAKPSSHQPPTPVVSQPQPLERREGVEESWIQGSWQKFLSAMAAKGGEREVRSDPVEVQPENVEGGERKLLRDLSSRPVELRGKSLFK